MATAKLDDMEMDAKPPSGVQPSSEIDIHPSVKQEDQLVYSKRSRKGAKGNMQVTIQTAHNVMTCGTMHVHMPGQNKPRSKKARKPVTTLQDPVTSDQMLDLKNKIGYDYKDLGRRLGFTDAEVEQLERQHQSDCSEVNYQILLKWTQREGSKATQAALANIFIKLKRGDLADILAAPELELMVE